MCGEHRLTGLGGLLDQSREWNRRFPHSVTFTSAPVLGQILQTQPLHPSRMGLSSLILMAPRDRLPGIGILEEQHKDPLFPKPDGGYTSPQGNELSFLRPSLLQRKSQAWRLGTRSRPLLPTISASGCPGLLKRGVQVRLPREGGPQEGWAVQTGNGSHQKLPCLFSR